MTPKTLVGRLKNEKFAFFWLLIGGGIGNVLLLFNSLIFLPSAILSLLIPLAIFGKLNRPKFWLGIDLLLSIAPLILQFVPISGIVPIEPAAFLPSALIILACILGIMNW